MRALTTRRLRLRLVQAGDAAEVHDAMASDFEVMRHTGTWPWPASMEATREKCAVGFGTEGGRMVALREGRIIGMVGLGHDGDLGYMLARSHWGQGYASEMAQGFVAHVLGTGLRRDLKAYVFDDNPASARVLGKLGFVEGPACSGRCEARDGDFPTRTFTLVLPRA